MTKFRGKWNDWKRKRAKTVKHRLEKGIENDCIRYPEMNSEFEVQSRLFHALRDLGFDVRGEVLAGLRSRFDLVIFDENRKPIRIIEVKKRKIRQNTKSVVLQHQRKEMLTQIERYKCYGVVLDIVQGMKDAELYLSAFSIDMPPYATITKSQTKQIERAVAAIGAVS